MAALLSQKVLTGRDMSHFKSVRILFIQIISQVTDARALNSAYAEDLEMVACFLLFQEIKDPLKKIEKPVTDLLEVIVFPQSEST